MDAGARFHDAFKRRYPVLARTPAASARGARPHALISKSVAEGRPRRVARRGAGLLQWPRGVGSGSGTSGSGSSSGSTTGCAYPCGCTPPPDPHAIVPPFDGGFADGGAIPLGLCIGPCTLDGMGATFVHGCAAVPLSDGGADWDVTCHVDHICAGRRPEGLCSPAFDTRPKLGTLFARMAHLEAASEPAFMRLARELAQHRAPVALVRAARRSAGDEVRHARTMARFARAHGGAVPRVVHAEYQPRNLEALGFENATEGCVRETLGAPTASMPGSSRGSRSARRSAWRWLDARRCAGSIPPPPPTARFRGRSDCRTRPPPSGAWSPGSRWSYGSAPKPLGAHRERSALATPRILHPRRRAR
jgi:hypothetical protein